jgi:hypothetical protein
MSSDPNFSVSTQAPVGYIDSTSLTLTVKRRRFIVTANWSKNPT